MHEFMSNNRYMDLRNVKIVRIILIIFFSVGIAGISIPKSREFFILLTPVALLISFIILAAFHQPIQLKKELLVFSTIFFVSFIIEAIGANTGKIFGSYSYGKGLGAKLFNTPLLIGFNWVMLVYCTAGLADKIKLPLIIKIITSSLLMLLYDVAMEQVAPEIGMWSFSGEVVPLSNYLAWFVVAFLFHSFLRFARIKVINRMVRFIFTVQFLFFLILAFSFRIFQ